MTESLNTPRAQLLAMLAIAAAVAAAFRISEGAGPGLLAGAWMLLLVAIIHFGRDRFDAILVMSGTGDERARSLYGRFHRQCDRLPRHWLVARDGDSG